MSPPPPFRHEERRPPHPLAIELIERVKQGTVLELGTGSGRNLRALQAAGLDVTSLDTANYTRIPARAGSFDAVISTHGLLHGNLAKIEASLSEIERVLRAGGVLYATFGSTRDARFGAGTRIDRHTFAPRSGDEAGVPHLFLDEKRVRRILHPFTVEELRETSVDEIVGKWAHTLAPLSAGVHWFAIAVSRSEPWNRSVPNMR